MRVFLDANILIRHITQDDKRLSPIARKIFKKVGDEEAVGYVSTLVLHEVLYVLENAYGHSRAEIVSSIKTILKGGNIKVIDLEKIFVIEALEDYVSKNVDFPDCVYKQICLNEYLEIVSFDKHFKKIGMNPLEKL